MRKPPRDPREVDDERREQQVLAAIALRSAIEQDDMEAAKHLWDLACDYTAARVVARKSGWLPVQQKGE